MVVLLDLFAAFDTVNHEIMLDRLQVTFGVDNSAIAWFRSYLAVDDSMSAADVKVLPSMTSSAARHRGRFLADTVYYIHP